MFERLSCCDKSRSERLFFLPADTQTGACRPCSISRPSTRRVKSPHQARAVLFQCSSKDNHPPLPCPWHPSLFLLLFDLLFCRRGFHLPFDRHPPLGWVRALHITHVLLRKFQLVCFLTHKTGSLCRSVNATTSSYHVCDGRPNTPRFLTPTDRAALRETPEDTKPI